MAATLLQRTKPITRPNSGHLREFLDHPRIERVRPNVEVTEANARSVQLRTPMKAALIFIALEKKERRLNALGNANGFPRPEPLNYTLHSE